MTERTTAIEMLISEKWRLGAALLVVGHLMSSSPIPVQARQENTSRLVSSESLFVKDQQSQQDWFTVAGVNTRESLHFIGPKGEQINLGAFNNQNVIVVEDVPTTQLAEAKIADVKGSPDLQVVYKSKPSISNNLPEGYTVPVIGCHSGPGWPCESFKTASIGEVWSINEQEFKVAQLVSLNFRKWNDARGVYPPNTHSNFNNGELFFRIFGGKNTLNFKRPETLTNYQALIITSCGGRYIGGEVGYEDRFAVLLEPVKN